MIIKLLEKNTDRPPWKEIAPNGRILKAYWSQWNCLELKDGILHRWWETDWGERSLLLVVPHNLRHLIRKELHDAVTAGHFSYDKTLARVRERFYWGEMGKEIDFWCRSCIPCQSRKAQGKRPRAPMSQFNVGIPMERIAYDVCGPFPETDRRNRYVLVVGDYFTKYVQAYAIPDQEAATIADNIVDRFIASLGVPDLSHSDQGTNFESNLWKGVCDRLGCTKTRTTPRHPQSDGMAERFMKTLGDLISLYCKENQFDWDEHLSLLIMAYNSSVHSSTGFSPALMMFGREMILPADIIFGTGYPGAPENNPSEYLEKLTSKMNTIHNIARDNLNIASDRQKKYYDRKASMTPYAVGDVVWFNDKPFKRGKSRKLQRPWRGPYRIMARINDLVYRIQEGPRTKGKVVHYNRLKPFVGPMPPEMSWEIKANSGTSQPNHETPIKPQQQRRSTRPTKDVMRLDL